MRDMVLNHASLEAGSPTTTSALLIDLARGMADLVRGGTADPVLRSARPLPETAFSGSETFWDALLRLRRRARDEYLFLITMTARSPLSAQLPEEVHERLRRCESVGGPAPRTWRLLHRHRRAGYRQAGRGQPRRVSSEADTTAPDPRIASHCARHADRATGKPVFCAACSEALPRCRSGSFTLLPQ